MGRILNGGAGGAASVGRGAMGMEARERLRAFLTLRLLEGVGDRTVHALLDRFGTPEAALEAPRRQFAACVNSRSAASARNSAATRRKVEELLVRIDDLELTPFVFGVPGYPPALEKLSDPPPLLFAAGDVRLLQKGRAVAIVGARRASAYGRRVAGALASDLAGRGIVIVSGMARGVDAAAHEGALEVGGGTIAVLGSGPDVPYPPSNRGLFRQIVRRGLVVTEFLPGDAPLPFNFPRRNRIIAALSGGVVVVEAGRRSGSLITVEHATDLGKDVFALPGSVESGRSAGSHALIRDGARLVTDAEDILSELGWAEEEATGERRAGSGSESSGPPPPDLGPDARVLWVRMAEGPAHMDDLLDRCGLSSARALAALSLLELSGWAVRQPGRRFARRSSRGTFHDPDDG